MSELDLSEHGDMTVNNLLDRAELDVIRNGETKTVPVKQLLHGLHNDTPVAQLAKASDTKPKARETTKPIINQAMSSESFRRHENLRMQKKAKFEREQQAYLQRGGAPAVENYW